MLLVLVFGLVLLNGAGITIFGLVWLNAASTSTSTSTSVWFVGAKSFWFVTKCVLHDMSEAPMSP